MTESSDKLRIDKWLWAARFFKTRGLATEAVDGGKVLVNGVRIKPAKAIASHDMLEIRVGKFRYEVEVLGLSSKRGPAMEAQKLYRETDDSKAQRAAIAAEIRAQPQPAFKGRPTKRARRRISWFEEENSRKGDRWFDD
jgi:ribosome-associated heat shock protein Hsp15